MSFQEFSRDYLSILIVLIFQHFSVIIIRSITDNFNFGFLILNDSEFAMFSLVHLYKVAINFLMFLNNYPGILLNYTCASQHLYIFHYLFEYC